VRPVRKRSRSLAIWGCLAAALVVIYVVEETDIFGPDVYHDIHGDVIKESRAILAAGFGAIAAVELAHDGATYRFDRDASGAWYYHHHDTPVPASDPHDHVADADWAALIDKAFGVFSRTQYLRNLGSGFDGADYGLEPPILAIGLFADKTDNPIVRYTVGDVEPDQLRQYAWRSDKDEIATIPIYQVENIMQLIAAVRGATAP